MPITKITNRVLANTAVTAGVYGGASAIPVVTVDGQGRLTNVTNTSINIPSGTTVFANSGQLTANASTGNVLLGLADTAVATGNYGSAAIVPTFTVDSKGRLTYSANVPISITGANIQTGTITGDDLAPNIIRANNVVANTLGSNSLTTTGVTANNYGGSDQIATITVDAQGRLTYAANVAIETGFNPFLLAGL